MADIGREPRNACEFYPLAPALGQPRGAFLGIGIVTHAAALGAWGADAAPPGREPCQAAQARDQDAQQKHRGPCPLTAAAALSGRLEGGRHLLPMQRRLLAGKA